MAKTTQSAEVTFADSNVVQNDKAISSETPKQIIFSALVELEQQRIEWEEGVYRTSNQALYAILAECLQYGADLSTTDAHKERREALETFYKERNYRWKKETPLMTKIVRAVFGDIDRRRISTYSLVLRQAKQEGVKPDQFAEWVDERGGVQEVRLARSSTFVSPKEKAASAQQRFAEMDTLVTVKSEALSLITDIDNIGEHCVLLALQEADGSFTVKALVNSGSAVNAAFTAVYQQQKSQNEQASKTRAEVEQEQLKEAA